MYKIYRTQRLKGDLSKIFAFFEDPSNLAKITPKDVGFEILNSDNIQMKEGTKIEYKIKVFGLKLHWLTLIKKYDKPNSFMDIQVKGPYKLWEHTHSFRQVDNEVEMIDSVDYDLYGWFLKGMVNLIVRPKLRAIFDFRAETIANYFKSSKV